MERKDTVKERSRADKTHDATAVRAILAEEAELIVSTTKPGEPMRDQEAIVKLEAMLLIGVSAPLYRVARRTEKA